MLPSRVSRWNRICILDKSGELSWGMSGFPTGAPVRTTWVPHQVLPHRMLFVPQVQPPLSPSLPRLPGTGFTLQLDTAFLYSSDAFFQTTSDGEADPSAPFPCVGKLCDERPSSNTVSAENLSPLVPLYDADEDFSVQARGGGGGKGRGPEVGAGRQAERLLRPRRLLTPRRVSVHAGRR